MSVEPTGPRVGAIRGLVAIVAFDVAGEVLARVADVPLPGPVIGMVLFFVALVAMRDRASHVERGAIITQLDVFRAEWRPIVVALVASTWLGLIAAAGAFALTARATSRDRA
jgi:holin-like protein